MEYIFTVEEARVYYGNFKDMVPYNGKKKLVYITQILKIWYLTTASEFVRYHIFLFAGIQGSSEKEKDNNT